jgi:hypothetical protein
MTSEAHDALALTPEDVTAALAEAGITVGDGYDGYSASQDGIRIPRLLYNRTGTDAYGQRIRVDMFWNNVMNTTVPAVDAILVMEHRTRAWFEWNDAEERNDYFCSSGDAVTGHREDTGAARACKTCPDAKWSKNPKGKRSVRCTDIRTVLGLDLATGEPFLLRFQKSSAKVIRTHTERHHDGKLRGPDGKRYNTPLYAYAVKLQLVLSDNEKYAVPTIHVTRIVTPDEAKLCRETLIALRPEVERATADRDVDSADAEDLGGAGGAGAGAGDASFNPDEF